MEEKKKKSKKLIPIIAIFMVVAVAVASFFIYINDYYRAQTDSTTVMAQEDNISVEKLEDGTIVYMPEKPRGGFVFYPGGKVEYTAYAPLMEACARRGIVCVLVEMPFNLAVFNVDAAKGIPDIYPEIENWYIGGHSLGGSMAASYLGSNPGEYNGLVLLGSYSTEDLSGEDIDVLSVFGSEDKVMNYEKYEENKSNLPESFDEEVIEGGCHAFFGMYGNQEGDGTPKLTQQEQITITADLIAEQIKTK